MLGSYMHKFVGFLLHLMFIMLLSYGSLTWAFNFLVFRLMFYSFAFHRPSFLDYPTDIKETA